MTLKSLASHFNLERVKKYGSCHQPLPSKFKLKGNKTPSTTSCTASNSTSNSCSPNGSVPSCRSSKIIRPTLNPNARKAGKHPRQRCKASALLDTIPVCKLQKTLIKYGCCHNMMQNVISLDFYEYPDSSSAVPAADHHCC